MKTKVCSICKKEKTLNNFHKDKYRPDKLVYCCKQCISKQAKKYYKSHKEKIKKYYKIHRKKILIRQTLPTGVYILIKSSAKRRQVEFNLSKEDFINWLNKQPKTCIYCKRTLSEALKDRNNKFKRLTIDRMDNSRGYEINNIVLSCYKCNAIKSNIFTYLEMLKIGKILQRKYNV